MTQRKRLRIWLVIGISIGIFGIGAIYVVVRLLEQGSKDFQNLTNLKVQTVYSIPAGDSALFSQECWSHMKVEYGWQNIYRQVSFLSFDQHYQVIMAKSPLKNPILPRALVHFDIGTGRGTNFVSYQRERLADDGEFQFGLTNPP
jgi:hypothetical protein